MPALALRRRRPSCSSTARRSNLHDKASLQRGAQIVRQLLSELPRRAATCATTGCTDLGLTEQQIRDNLVFTGRQGRRAHEVAMRPEGREGVVRRRRRRTSRWSRARARAGRPTGSTPTCAASTATRAADRLEQRSCSRTSACRTCCGSSRASRCCRSRERMDRTPATVSTRKLVARQARHAERRRIRPATSPTS